MTPEERAKAATDEIMDQVMSLIQINGEPIMSVDVLNPAPALIAQAIRQAEASARNEALEEAAQTSAARSKLAINLAYKNACAEIASSIRSLKSKQEG
jgi:hypothetical protein